MKFELYNKKNAPPASRPLLQAFEDGFSFILNVVGELAGSPAALEGTVALMGLMQKTSLTRDEQWIVLLTVAAENSADYCVAANSTVAKMMDVSETAIDEVRKGKPIADPKLEAIRRFTAEMVRQRGRVSQEVTAQFFAAGFTREQVLDVILGIATETIASYTTRVSESTPMDEVFVGYTWRHPEATAA